jgi:hypothetical protein
LNGRHEAESRRRSLDVDRLLVKAALVGSDNAERRLDGLIVYTYMSMPLGRAALSRRTSFARVEANLLERILDWRHVDV